MGESSAGADSVAARQAAGQRQSGPAAVDALWRCAAPYLALVTAWVAMLGSLYFSEVRGLVPCGLCWFQRIILYPLTLVIAVGVLRRDKGLPLYVLPLTLLGIVVSTYHYLVQKTDLFDHAIACNVGVPCSAIYINWLGFVTIPFLALTAAVIISLCMSAMRAGEWADASKSVPWARVIGCIAAVFAAFAVLYAVRP
jgi:disulfide bond formation protein DsbB